ALVRALGARGDLRRVDPGLRAVALDAGRAPSEAHDCRGPFLRVLLEHRLDVHLLHAVQGLGRGPSGPRVLARGGRLAARAARQARELPAGVAREIRDVLRIVRRKAERADLGREAEPAGVLHRPRGRGVRLRKLRRSRIVLEEHAGDVPPAELDRGDEPGRTAANDQHARAWGVAWGVHGASRSPYAGNEA